MSVRVLPGRAKRAQTKHFQLFLDNTAGLIFITAADGTVCYESPACERVLGYTPEDMIGDSLLSFVHPDDTAALQSILTEAPEQPCKNGFVRCRLRHHNGEWCVFGITATGFSAEAGTMSVILRCHEAAEQQPYTQSAGQSAGTIGPDQEEYDTLLHLPNRSLFVEMLQQAVLPSGQKGLPLALLLMDLDQFREINGTFGHRWGDTLLRRVGSRVRQALRKSDCIVRLGGDEFGVLLPTVGSREGVIRIVRRILNALEEPFLIEGHPVRVGSSIGIALSPEHGADVDALLRCADIAMYQAKHTGLGFAVYADEYDLYSPDRLTLATELRRAIDLHQLTLYFQPKIHMIDGQVREVEALTRWEHPERGLLSPDQFIPLAEQTGLIHPFSRWVLRSALRQSKVWHRKGFTSRIAVNLSMHNLQDERLPHIIKKLLKTSGGNPNWLGVEVTESALAADPIRAVDILSHLHDIGVWIAIDDFGTGYSSFAALKRLPVDEIKIDKSFVMGLTSDIQDAAIVRATIDLGQSLGLTVTAEGVENQETWDYLAELGCDLAQGYYCSRPVPAADIIPWLQPGQQIGRHTGRQTVVPLQQARTVRRRTAVG